ncbi:MAG: YlxM family DNA-binding protein [Bacillota bacterium]|jgi:predicted DNA-binding protein YlxM (UPF0122 family)|nr:YlxM family DNA-binding protein [Bacillota bacterium]HHT91114.1 YlxM family DNA-binding protein [Bacillota bacterium]
MENTFRMNLLYDFYGPLLTDRQQEIFQMYFHEDLSLGEIGEELDVSRQAVYDSLKRVGSILEGFEAKLNLVRKHQERQIMYERVRKLVDLCQEDAGHSPHLVKIKEMMEKAQATT